MSEWIERRVKEKIEEQNRTEAQKVFPFSLCVRIIK